MKQAARAARAWPGGDREKCWLDAVGAAAGFAEPGSELRWHLALTSVDRPLRTYRSARINLVSR